MKRPPVGIQNGDIIESKSSYLFVNHFGVFIEIDGNPHVIHIVPKGAKIESWDSFFSKRAFVQTVKTKSSGISTDLLLKRYLSKRNDYSLFSYDCEDFAEKMTGDNSNIKQMEGVAIFGAAIIFVLLIAD